jgi:outer membrane receptor for ferrienterochelin and colicin
MLNKKVRLTVIASASAILGITTQGAVAHEIATSPEDDSLEKIAVYGEKANRKLKDTASSVSVITEEVLKSLQHISVSSTVADIPNIVVLSSAVPAH